jgi:capsular polysaccharide export protein
VVLFGDCRPVHRVACRIAHERGVHVGAFEEGYIRPNFVTFERSGVNGYSLVPRERNFYAAVPSAPRGPQREFPHAYGWAALWAVLYYISSAVAYPLFRRHRHHRPLTLLEAWPWMRAGWRKLVHAWTERRVVPALTGALSKRFFLVPLQLSLDSQVYEHSRFASVADFIRDVVASFAAHAPGDVSLVIKHHPLDRGHHDYAGLIRELGRQHGLQERLMYIHDQHLPTLFDHMRGAVVINSTVGLSALTHGAPLKTLGRAIYDLDGLTFQEPLDRFWRAAEGFRPDLALLQRFRSYLIDHTQINGSFYTGARCHGGAGGDHGRAGAAGAGPAPAPQPAAAPYRRHPGRLACAARRRRGALRSRRGRAR